MTNGLRKGRKTLFIKGFAIQWFHTMEGTTKAFIYEEIPNNRYIHLSEFGIDYIADEYSVERCAREKISELM